TRHCALPALTPRQPVLSFLLRLPEGFSHPIRGLLGGVDDVIQRLPGLTSIVTARLGEVIPERPRGCLRPTPGVLAPKDPVVLPRCHPLLQLTGAHSVHRMGEGQGIEDLV